jgi:hypothetical protein
MDECKPLLSMVLNITSRILNRKESECIQDVILTEAGNYITDKSVGIYVKGDGMCVCDEGISRTGRTRHYESSVTAIIKALLENVTKLNYTDRGTADHR